MNLQDNAKRIKYFDKLLDIGITNLYYLILCVLKIIIS